MAALLLLSTLVAALCSVNAVGLDPKFYASSCPTAAAIVSAHVKTEITRDPGVAAPLLRLHFHDCFVQGCDGSVLLSSNKTNKAEKDATPNFQSLAGFEIIDAIKAAIETACPGTVSCADILALTAREAVHQAGGPLIPVALGRRDSFDSFAARAEAALPGQTMTYAQLIKNFAAAGLDPRDVVVLSGAHTIGVAKCNKITARLHPHTDATLDSTYASTLHSQCDNVPSDAPSPPLPLDPVTTVTFDNQYFKNLLAKKGLLKSDSNLAITAKSLVMVKAFAANQSAFFEAFSRSFLKMGANKPLTGKKGEIRQQCAFNNRVA